ncbi:MAG: hypothetical protein NTZ92_05875 [Candidatus Omnitrophica bacterium]|nr:hypothetical protein [Candidatus Omnitrophota bacterium]
MNIRHEGGQSILEYTLVLGAVIAVIVLVLLGKGGIKDKVQASYERTGDAITQTTNDLSSGVFSGTGSGN